MIDLYSWGTPNGHKVHIMLEECGFEWKLHKIDIGKDEQFAPDFLKISPNNRIPAIVDHDNGTALFESGAILIYLANKAGKFMPEYGSAEFFTCMQWLMWQMGGVGPMFGQAHHFRIFAPEQVPYGIKRYTDESNRLCRVMDKRLGEAEYLAGDYSIADMATYPWVRFPEKKGIEMKDYPNLSRWFNAIESRPAVQIGIKVFD